MNFGTRVWLVGALAASLSLLGCNGGGGTASGGGSASSGGGSSSSSGGGGGSSGGGTSSSGGGTSSSGGGTSSSGGGTSSSGGGSGGVSLTLFCPTMAQAYCDALVRCKQLDTAQSALCVAVITTNCDTTFAAKARNGTRTYDASQAAACFGSITNAQCLKGVTMNTPECSSTALFAPNGTTGNNCTSTADCKTGNTCASQGAGNCSTCQPLKVSGADCVSSTECQTGLTCQVPVTGGSTKCEGPRALGSYCPFVSTASTACASAFCATGGNAADGGRGCSTFLATGSVCTSTGQEYCDPTTAFCPTGLIDGGISDGGTRRCTAKSADGQPCTTSTTCLTPVCNRASPSDGGAGPRTCGYVPLNQSCGGTGDCGFGNFCQGYQFGTLAGTCTKRLALGSACSINETASASGCTLDGGSAGGTCLNGMCSNPNFSLAVNSQCDNYYQCVNTAACHEIYSQDDGGLGICKPRVGEGGDCSDYDIFADMFFPESQFCNDGLFCNNSNICVPYVGAGATCGADAGCKAALNCDRDGGTAAQGDGICRAPLPVGTECYAQVSCQNNNQFGFCLYDGGLQATSASGNRGVCSGLQANSAPCYSASQCSSNRCFRDDGGSGGRVYTDGGIELGSCRTSCFP